MKIKIKTIIISILFIIAGCKDRVPQDSVLIDSFKIQFPGLEMATFNVKPTFSSNQVNFYKVGGNIKSNSPFYEVIDDLGFNSYLVKQTVSVNEIMPFEVTLTQKRDDKGMITYQFGRLMPSLTEEMVSKPSLDKMSENYVVGNSTNLQQDIDKQFEFVKQIIEADHANIPKLVEKSDELLAKLNLANKKANDYWQSIEIEGKKIQNESDFYDYFDSKSESVTRSIDTKVEHLMEQYDKEYYNIKRNEIFEQVKSEDEEYYEALNAERAEVETNYYISFQNEADDLLNKISAQMLPYETEFEKLAQEYSELNNDYYQVLDEIDEINNVYLRLEDSKQALTDLIASHGFKVGN